MLIPLGTAGLTTPIPPRWTRAEGIADAAKGHVWEGFLPSGQRP